MSSLLDLVSRGLVEESTFLKGVSVVTAGVLAASSTSFFTLGERTLGVERRTRGLDRTTTFTGGDDVASIDGGDRNVLSAAEDAGTGSDVLTSTTLPTSMGVGEGVAWEEEVGLVLGGRRLVKDWLEVVSMVTLAWAGGGETDVDVATNCIACMLRIV